ncbi:lytic polysaccharide monooxygenase [Myxococcus landrumensis]|uniref:Lytic polysaccharide monooxygenase n=1 Tax=Myxococcus landrumensis TaxID=2813577 RepID=A0ABX7NBX7_9BACT|nr:lytic polysaccharide monooxygenase [Myxococcus landrumus]QSQ16287.1 lytic polysaccharide monooxygenase [Myxococcus landrumus]
MRRPLAASLFVLSLLSGSVASAHGSMEIPLSRIYSCFKEGPERPKSAACAAAIQNNGTQQLYDWNGVRQGNANGRHRELIADGMLCSGGSSYFKGMDLARTDWVSTPISPNASNRYDFVFHATAAHATAYFHLYVTKPGYNPAAPLKWSDLEATPFCTVNGIVAQNFRYRLSCPFPAGRTGNHVVYAIWQRSDSPEAFYSCSDVRIGGTVAPTSWVELGSLQAREDLPARSKVTLRVFDSAGRDAETHPILIDTAAKASQWMQQLAQRVNAASRRVQVGELQTDGNIRAAPNAATPRIYSRESSDSFQLDIEKPASTP